MNDYFLILTTVGKAKVAEAIINNTKVNITNVVFGDGNGSVVTPTPAWTALARKVYETAPNSVNIHKDNNNWISVKAYIPKDTGGWFIREIGLFDDKNNLIAVGNYPDTYKPTTSLGVGVDMFIEVIMEVSNANAITLQVNPSQMLVTKEEMETFVKENAGTRDNIGTLEFSARQDIPFGRLRCDGTIYSADTSSEFANFYDNYLLTGKFKTLTFANYETHSAQNDGECGYFGIDTATRKFRVPTIKNGSALTQAENLTELGKWYEGAIENITGYFTAQQGLTHSSNDEKLFKTRNRGQVDKGNSSGWHYVNQTTFDASQVVKTAEETRTRQIRYPILVTITNATASVPITDNIWNDFLSALANKANTDLSNTPANIDYVINSYRKTDATEWYREYKSGYVEQGGLAYVNAVGDKGFTLSLFIPLATVLYCMGVPQSVTRSDTWNNIYGISVNSGAVLAVAARDIRYMWWEVKGIKA
jgi:phage-related tail fiber protein